MRRLLLVGLLSICFVSVAMAQSTGTATLTGSVTDASGAVVPRANVTVLESCDGLCVHIGDHRRRNMVHPQSESGNLPA